MLALPPLRTPRRCAIGLSTFVPSSSARGRAQSGFARPHFVEDTLPRPSSFDGTLHTTVPAAPPPPKSQPLDTWRFVSRLEKELPPGQPDALLDVLTEALSTSTLLAPCVSRADFDRTKFSQHLDIHELDTALSRLNGADFGAMRADVARMKSDLDKLRQRLKEEVMKAESAMKLEIGLEKGRIRDMHAAEELRINEVEGRIDSEISAFKTGLETIKWELFRVLLPMFTATAGLTLAYMRLMR
ncbi:hypothetical protein DFJ74DRAFT_600991 [Hyaloraphidium curvatum]|nr:hypothetical protein DFJ74DRAFT_600991 [Hyaloraphidium curvatum]